MAKVNVKNWLIVGAIASLITPFLMKLLAMIPQVAVTFSTIEINLRSKITGAPSVDVGNFLLGLLGLEFTLPALLMAAIGGALLVLAARYIIGMQKFYKPKNRLQKLTAVFLVASLLQLFIGSGLSIPSVMLLFGFLVNGFVLGFIMDKLAKHFGIAVE